MPRERGGSPRPGRCNSARGRGKDLGLVSRSSRSPVLPTRAVQGEKLSQGRVGSLKRPVPFPPCTVHPWRCDGAYPVGVSVSGSWDEERVALWGRVSPEKNEKAAKTRAPQCARDLRGLWNASVQPLNGFDILAQLLLNRWRKVTTDGGGCQHPRGVQGKSPDFRRVSSVLLLCFGELPFSQPSAQKCEDAQDRRREKEQVIKMAAQPEKPCPRTRNRPQPLLFQFLPR